MPGVLIIILLLASILFLSTAFLMVALRMGKNFNQMGSRTPQTGQRQRRTGTGQ